VRGWTAAGSLGRLAAVLAALLLAQACGLRLVTGPEAVFPPDGAALSCSPPDFGTVRFSWTRWSDVSEYILTVYNSAGQPISTTNSGGTSAEVTLQCDAEYSWEVRSGGRSPRTSPRYRFRLLTPQGGDIALLSPEDGAVIECMSTDQGQVQFAWGAVQRATAYILEVYRSPDGALFTSRRTGATGVALEMACRPELATEYRWRVGAEVPGARIWSGFRSFSMTMERIFLISPPNGSQVAVSPANCNGENTIRFSWTPIRDVQIYTLQVFRNNALVATGATSQTLLQLSWNATSCGTYSWQVTATRTGAAPPASSDVWTFTTVPQAAVLRR